MALLALCIFVGEAGLPARIGGSPGGIPSQHPAHGSGVLPVQEAVALFQQSRTLQGHEPHS